MWENEINEARKVAGLNPVETGKSISPWQSAIDKARADAGIGREPMKPKEALPENIPSRGITGFLKDTGIDIAKGVVGLGESAVGIADVLTGNQVGKGLAVLGYDPSSANKILSSAYSEARQIANRNVEEAKGFFGTAQALVENPSAAFGAVMESAPGTVGIAGVARGVARSMLTKAGLKAGTAEATKFLTQPSVMAKLTAAGAAAEGLQSTGSIQEQGRQAGKEWTDTVLPSIAAGIGTAGIAFLTGKLLPDAEVKIAVNNMMQAEKKSLLQSGWEIAKCIFKEGALEEMPQSAQEQIFTNLALGKPWNEGVAESAAQGLVVGGLQGGGMIAGGELMSNRRAEKEMSPEAKVLTKEINEAAGLDQKVQQGKASDEEKTRLNELTADIKARIEVLRQPGPEEEPGAAGAVKPPAGPAGPAPKAPEGGAGEEKKPVSDAKKVLLGNEPEAKKETTTARSMLTEGDVDIQSEEELSPEAVQKIEETAAAKTAGTTGKRKKIAPPEPGEAAGTAATGKPEGPGPEEGPGGGVVDITEHAKAEDVELFAKWDKKEEGAPKFVRARVEKLFAEKGEAGVNAEYKGEDNVSRYARYRLEILTGKKGEEEHAKTETEAAATGVEVAAGAERGGGAAAEGAGETYARGAEAGAAATAEEGEAEVKEKALTGDKAAEVGGAPGEGTLAEEGFRAWKANKAYIDNNGNYHVPLPGSKRGPIAKWNKAVKKLYPKHEDFQKASDEWALKASEEATAGGASGKPVTAGTTGKTTSKPMEPAQPEKAAAKKVWQQTQKEYAEFMADGKPISVKEWTEHRKGTHRREVEKAIAEGKDVPAEVLADYPDLRKEVAKNATEEGKQPEGGVGEHQRDDERGVSAEAGGRGVTEQRPAQPHEEGQAEKGEVAEPEGWRKNIFKARKYAKALGVDIANKTLNQVVADVDAHREAAAPTAAKAEEGGLDLEVSGQAKPMPEREGVTYTVQKRKPDMIPHTFKVIVTRREGGFLSEIGTGMTAKEAYDKAVEAFDAKAAPKPAAEKPITAGTTAPPARALEGEPNWNFPPPEAWEKNIIKARKYAKELKIPFLPSSGADHALSLTELVNAVHEKLKQAPGAATEKPAEAPEGEPNWDFTPKDGWESNLLKAREYAIALKIPTTGVSLEDLVANIKGKLKESPENGETGKEAPKAGEEEKAAPGAAGEAGEGAAIDNEIEAASMDEISDMIDDAVAEKEAAEAPAAAEPGKPSEAPPEKKTRTTGTTGKRTRTKPEVKTKALEDILADVASQGVTGAGEAITGLYELFGGSALKAGLGTFDEGTYAKAKPHFQASYEAFKTAGKSLKEYVKSVTDQLGRTVKPYLMKFIEELKTAAKELKEKVKAEREANKKNKFVDYGFVYDPYSMKDALRKAQVGTLEFNLKKTFAAVERSKVFQIKKTEAMTAGAERYMGRIRDALLTFPEGLSGNIFQTGSRRWARQTWLQKIKRTIEYQDHTLDEVTEAAANYAADLSALSNYLNQSTDVANMQYRLVSYLFSKETADKYAAGLIDLGNWNTFLGKDGALAEDKLSEAGKSLIRWTKGGRYRGQYASMIAQGAVFKDTEDVATVQKKRMTRVRNQQLTRAGMDEVRPGDKNIESTDEYNGPFGFKGVAWGGYVEGDERQRLANASFDAFHDLAWVLGTTPKSVSIGGRLSVQFGNLGTANTHAAGLYFPDQDTLNLAKGSGDGCLAHEWGHGLDDILNNVYAIDEIVSIKTALERVYDYDEAEALVRRILDPTKDNEYARMVHKGKKGAELAKAVLIERWQATVMKESTFFEQCKKTSNAEYQKNREEMFARAFEAYVYDRLAERGSNNYLVNDWASDGFVSTANGYNGLIYPSGEERRLFNSYIKHFLDGIEWTDGVPRMKDDYVSILKAIEKESQAKLQELLDRIDTIYQEMFQGQKSEDGLYWYRFDEMSRGIGMQPLGYFAFNDTFKEEGQNGTGVVGYPEPIRAEEVVEFALKPILYSGEKTLTKEAKGGERSNERVGEEGVRGVEEEQAENVPGTSEKGAAEDGGAVGAGEDEGAGGGVGTGGMGPGVRTGRGTSDLDIAAEREGTEGPGAGPDALAGTGNYHISPEKFAVLGRRTLEDRFKDNIAALRVLKALEKEGRKPTPEEKDVLFRYSGWGGLGEATRRYASSGWEAKSRILHDLLTDEEINSLGDSSATAYYTPGEVVEGIYKAVARMGFKTGSVLDSATGTGNFIGIMPRDMEARANIRGVEPEMFSHKIAAYLYDSATITQGKLQDVKLPVNFFDLAVTNVPFADVVTSDKLNKKGLKLHDYFFIKNLHHVRPGGIVAMITTTGTMDSADQTARKEIAKVADFIGAIRLPEKLFSATDISTDIIFLQKRQHGAPVKEVAAWMEKTPVKMGYYGMTGSTEVGVNEYFKEHPEMVLGEMLAKDNRWGNVGVAVAGKEEGLAASLEAAIAKLPENIFTAETIDTTAKKEDLVPAPDHVKDHAFFEKDGKLFQNINAQAVPVPEALGSDKDYGKKVRLMIGMVQARRTVLRTQLDGLSDAEKDAARKELNRLYDAFVKKYGFVHDKAHDKVFVEDPDHPNVMALEIWDEEAKKGKKADIFREDVIPKYERQTKADNAVDALAITLNDRGHVDIKHIASLTGLSPEAIYAELKGRIFKDPESNSYVTREQYLSGNVVAKLETAREYLATDPDMDANIKALEAVRPPLLGPGDFSIRLGAPWIHPRYVKDFMTGLMEVNERRMKLHVSHNAMLGSWHIQAGRTNRYRSSDAEAQREFRAIKSSALATATWGTPDKNFIDLMECALNNRRPIVTKRDPVTEKSYTDIRATEAANAKLREIFAEFQRWALADTARANELVDLYNHDVNNLAVIECDGSHLTLPGKNIVYPAPTKDRTKGLYHTQLNAIWRYLTFGNSYFAHDMGTGKTITLAATAMEAKRLGLKKKPMILTFTNVVEQFRDEFQRLYPTANLLVLKLGKDPLKNKELLARVSTNNWDCVIMSQTSFDHIRLSPEAEAGFIQEELEEYRAELSRVQADEGGSNKKSKKQSEIANAIARMEERLKKVLTVDEKERSQHLFFEELGVDLVLVDEAHTYKNVPFATKVGNIKFINPRGAATSQLFEFKMRYLNNTYRAPNGRPNAVVLASGTPLTNSVGELFNIQKILQPDLMRENNLHRFDAWASSFGEIGEIREPKPAGIGYKMSTAFRRFINVPELKRLAYQVLDVVSSEDVGLTRPDLETGAPINVRVAQNEYVTAYQDIIQQRADEVEINPKEAEYRGIPDNLLRLVSDGRKIAIDQRLVGDYADTEEQPDSKIAQAADKIVEIYHKTKKEKGVQLVFADLGVPKRYSTFKEKTEAELEQMSEEQLSEYQLAMVEASETKWNTYDGMKEALIKRGIPADEIAFIQDAEHSNPETKKKRLRELFRKTNKGTVRVLMGTTKKLGTGANVQERVKAVHHLDVWWNYSSYAQRNARGWRTGNTYKEISIYNYVTENTVDQFVWNKVFEKGRILTRLMSKDMVEREIEDLTPDQITARQAASIGDPLREREFDLIVKKDKLRGEYTTFLNNRNDQQRKMAWLTEMLTANTAELKRKFNQRTAFWKIDAVQFAGDSEVYSIERDGGKIAEKVQAALKRIGDDIFRESSTNRPIAMLGWHEDIGKGKEKIRNFNAMPYTLALKRPTVYLGFGEGQAPLNFVVRGPDGDTERTFAHWKTKTGEKGTTFSGLEMSESVAQAMSHMERGLTTRIESLQNDIERAEKEIPRLEKELEKDFDTTDLQAVEQELKEVQDELYSREQKAKGVTEALEEQADAAAAINKYYIRQDGGFVEVKGIPVTFNGYEDLEFFASKKGNKWTITDRSTGRSLLSGDTKSEAIENTRRALEQREPGSVKKNIKIYRDEEGGATPWWQAKQNQEPTAQYSLREGRGGMPTLEDVQKIFAGQEVRQLQSGAIAIQTRGGHTLVVNAVESITPDRISLRIGYGKTKLKPGQAITGAYISDKTTQGFTAGTIELNRLHGDTWTLAHESVHFMEDAGILSQFDVITLKGHIKGLVKAGKFEPKNRDDIGGAEDRAEFLAQQLTAKAKPTGVVANILSRIQEFIDRLVNAFGKRTVGGIVRDIESGRIYERSGEGKSARGAARYEISAFAGGAADILASPEGRFSTKYIGTGTSSTAFGWGLYFTSRAEVAKRYADLAAKLKGTHQQKGSHHLFAVTLHKGKAADQYDYLSWDGKLTERQAMKIKNRLQASGQATAMHDKAMQAALTGGTGAQTYEALTDMLGSKEAASKWLLKAGIDGTTYRADYVMDNVPEGTRHYVVFDENAIQITETRQYLVRDLFKQKQPNDPIDSSSRFKDVNARLKEARGIKTAGLKDRARDALIEGFQHFTRHFQHLDPKKDGAVIDVLRQFQEVPAWAKEETANRLVDFVGKLTPNGREVFAMNIILPDMLRDIDSGLLDPASEEGLPFGYKDRAQVEEDLDNFKAKMTPEIERALEKRNAFMKDLTDQLIEHKLLNKELANNPEAYFHHQVLDYMNYKANPSWGVSSGDVRTHRKGWQMSRKGSHLDYNTEYVESEFEVVSQALAQIETVKTLKEVERLTDIKKQLTDEARRKNMAAFRRWAEENVPPDEDPLKPFKTKMAIGFAKLTKAIEDGDINVPPEFEDVAEHFVEQAEALKDARKDERDVAEVIVPHPKTFAFLSWLVNHSQAGAMPAAMVFKAIAQRNQFIRQAVGDKWVTYRNLVPEGYVVHKPEASSTFYFANSLTDRVVDQVVSGQRALADTDLRKVLARGKDAEWVVPEGVSKTLNEFRPALADSLPGRMSKDLLSTWKQWVLMNPFRVLKYNVNNMSGDMDICMAYDPKIITQYMVPAFKELWAQYQGTASGKLKEEMSALARKGLIGSGMTAMDIPELNKVGSTKALVDFMDGRSKGALMWWWSQSKKLSTLRENVLRLAAYRYFTDQLKTRTDVYGASRKAEIDAIADRDDRAVKLARELIGDYGNISHAGQYLRERIIPFYSWLEINAPRYVRLFRNLKHEGGSMTGLAGTMAWKATKLGLKACALMAMVALWNGAMFPDEEEELQETGREQLHLILGRRADGSIITLRFQGALSDALNWFGMDNPFETAKRISKGRMSGKDVAKEVVTAAPKKLFQGLRPEPKLLYEVVSGQSYFPDPTRPRPIHDTAEHIARVFSLDRVYNRLAGKPIKGGDWSEQLKADIQGLLLAESDPGEQAYYTARKYVFEWLDKNGKEKPVSMPTNRSNALYYYKQALRFGDFEAAARYLGKYKELGGKESNVSQSIKRAAPLASLKLADRYQFKQSLTAEQQQTLKVALDWYKVHYVGGRREEVERRAAG